ncbi:YchJ family protein [Pedococcus sp. 5OH_020]|uniref:YchJ family protein n=1 Tax=Pedococcus sp. 5OH_020 TaxID=2989814 RepID=UPI002FDBAF7D
MSAFGRDVPHDCPCGSGAPYAACCGPLHQGERAAATAEQLMRSRYAAYVVGDQPYLERTWHPRTRPSPLALDDVVGWAGLSILATADGRDFDSTGEVEFRAAYRGGALHERSRFVRRAGAWVYVDGDILGDIVGDVGGDIGGDVGGDVVGRGAEVETGSSRPTASP